MTENEKKLRDRITGTLTPGRLTEALDALLAEMRQSARDAALEEAATRIIHLFNDDVAGGLDTPRAFAQTSINTVRALKSQPARRYLDAEKVREVLLAWRDHPVSGDAWTCQQVAAELSLDLDAALEHKHRWHFDWNNCVRCEDCGRPRDPGSRSDHFDALDVVRGILLTHEQSPTMKDRLIQDLRTVPGLEHDTSPECPVCEAPAGQHHKMSCRTTERAAARLCDCNSAPHARESDCPPVEYATEENGLLPKRRKS